jgi:transaldolase
MVSGGHRHQNGHDAAGEQVVKQIGRILQSSAVTLPPDCVKENPKQQSSPRIVRPSAEGENSMKFFVYTADVNEIREFNDLGLVDGVTTNPSLILKSGRIEVTKEICSIVEGPVSAEVAAIEYEQMMKEAAVISKIANNICIKVPLTLDGLKACKALSSDGCMVNVTLCFSANQALLAAKAGATFVSPFVGRLDDIHLDGADRSPRSARSTTITASTPRSSPPRSARSTACMWTAALIGADVATCPARRS